MTAKLELIRGKGNIFRDFGHANADVEHLKGFHPTRYSIHVNGPWCITFEFARGDVVRVDFEQYH